MNTGRVFVRKWMGVRWSFPIRRAPALPYYRIRSNVSDTSCRGEAVSDTHTRNSAPGTKGRVVHWATGYDMLVSVFLLGRERSFREKLLGLAHLRPGEVVLDVGCGTGTLAIAARRHVGASGSVHGVDASPEMIARATKKATKAGEEITFRTGVVEALPYPDAHVDVVLSSMMLHHLPRKARQQCVHEIRRVLKPGGRVLAVDFGPAPGGRKGLFGHLHRHGHVDLHDIMDTLAASGLSVLESGAVGVRNLYYALATAPSLVPGVAVGTGSTP